MKNKPFEGTRHTIKTVKDIVELLSNPETAKDFREDLNTFLDTVQQYAATTNEVLDKIEKLTGIRPAIEHQCDFVWIDDGHHEKKVRYAIEMDSE